MAVITQKKRTAKDLARYSGKWVAFIDGKVIDSSNSLKSLMDKLKDKPLSKKPSIMLVPRKDEGPYILYI